MKKIAIGVILVLLVVFGVFFWKVQREDKAQQQAYEKWMQERRPLTVKKADYNNRLQKLEQEYENYTTPKATTHILFTDLHEDVHQVCYPLMKEYGYTGTLILSSEQLPGQENCMSVQQFQELLEAGWRTCIQWDETFMSERAWASFKSELDAIEIQVGEQIYFPRQTYAKELDEKISDKGFTIVICEYADTESPLQSEYEEGLWHVGAMGAMTKQPKFWLREAVATKANVVYTVGFSLEYQKYNPKSFEGMLNAFDEYEASGGLFVDDLFFARDHYYSRLTGVSPEYDEKYQQEKQQLEKKIEEIDAKLKEIDAKYQ